MHTICLVLSNIELKCWPLSKHLLVCNYPKVHHPWVPTIFSTYKYHQPLSSSSNSSHTFLLVLILFFFQSEMAFLRAHPYSFLLLFFFAFAIASAQLSPSFYDKACPGAFRAIRSAVYSAVLKEHRMGASLLRLHFHDCFVNVRMYHITERAHMGASQKGS